MNRRRDDSSVDTRHLLPRFRGDVVSTVRVKVRYVVPEEVVNVSVTVAGGDSRALRGIPAVGRGVSGQIAGTQPEQAVCEDAA